MKVFYGLSENPFALTPDPRFISWSYTHRETFRRLTCRHQGPDGMIVVTGDGGTGKTTLLRALRAYTRVHEQQTRMALLPHPGADTQELFARMAHDLGVAGHRQGGQGDLPALEKFFAQCLQAGERILLLLDAAHEVPDTLLDELELLASIGAPRQKLFQIILAGRPSLQDKLNKARVGVVCHLAPLTPLETQAYITKRLQVAGSPGGTLFHPAAVAEIHRFSQGIPRLINVICNHALLDGFLGKSSAVDAELVRHTVRTLGLEGTQEAQLALHETKGNGNRHRRSEQLLPSAAEGVPRLPAKQRPQASRRTTTGRPLALVSLSIMLLVAAGTFLGPERLWQARGTWHRALLARLPWGTHLPVVSDGIAESVPGSKDRADTAEVAVQRAPAAPVESDPDATGRSEHVPHGPERPAGAPQGDPFPDITRTRRPGVTDPLPPALPAGGDVGTPRAAVQGLPRLTWGTAPDEGRHARPHVARQSPPSGVPATAPAAPGALLPGARDARMQTTRMPPDVFASALAASIRARISRASACSVTQPAPSSQAPPVPVCGPRQSP